jgi:hypothetical protein
MLKKLIFLTISLSIVAFAQGTYEPSEVEESSNYETQDNSTSSYDSQEDTYKPQQVTYQTNGYESASDNNNGSGSEPGLYIGIHPVSLLILTAIGMPTICLTIEKTISQKSSAIIRPLFMSTDLTSDDFKLSMLSLGLTGGYRHYFRKQHKGLFIEGELQFSYLDLEASDSYNYAKGSAIGFGPYLMLGRKWTFGSMALSIDAGIGLNFYSLSVDSNDEELNDDLNESLSAFGYDVNLIWSLGI